MPTQRKEELRKVTVMLPRKLVEDAMKASGEGLTPTIRRALEEMKTAEAYERIRKLRGTFKFSIDVDQLREDRD